MSPSNMISVIVATCFVVFIGLGNTSLLYYAAKVSDSVQGKGITGRYKVCVGRQTTLGRCRNWHLFRAANQVDLRRLAGLRTVRFWLRPSSMIPRLVLSRSPVPA